MSLEQVGGEGDAQPALGVGRPLRGELGHRAGAGTVHVQVVSEDEASPGGRCRPGDHVIELLEVPLPVVIRRLRGVVDDAGTVDGAGRGGRIGQICAEDLDAGGSAPADG
jgi:hypothetical protein